MLPWLGRAHENDVAGELKTLGDLGDEEDGDPEVLAGAPHRALSGSAEFGHLAGMFVRDGLELGRLPSLFLLLIFAVREALLVLETFECLVPLALLQPRFQFPRPHHGTTCVILRALLHLAAKTRRISRIPDLAGVKESGGSPPGDETGGE